MNPIVIDNEAKAKVDLRKIDKYFDGAPRKEPFYVGKYQFPGTMEFQEGVSFMIFLSEDGFEELQIGPLDPTKRSRNLRNSGAFKGGRFCIDLHPYTDSAGKRYYVGEAIGIMNMPLKNGIFFTVFVTREGQEELQISSLNHKKKFDDNEIEDSDRENPAANWAPRDRIASNY